jgi:hypothetical protein
MMSRKTTPFAGSGMPNQVDDALGHAMSGTELSHVRTDSNDCEYSQPFRHIQYNRTDSLRPIATLAMLLCRRIPVSCPCSNWLMLYSCIGTLEIQQLLEEQGPGEQ